MLRGMKPAWRAPSRCVCVAWAERASRVRASLRSFATQGRPAESPPPTEAFPFPYPDGQRQTPLRMRGDFTHSTHARNEMLRKAFKSGSKAIQEDVKHKLSSPFVPPARDYPLSTASKASMIYALRVSRVLVGFDMVPSRDDTCRIPDWTDILDLLKRTTPRFGEVPVMTALRIVMPESWDMAVEGRKVEFISAATGLVSKLRMDVDRQGPSSFFLRGRAAVLAEAAQELVASCEGVQIYKMGDVAAHDYETKRLWPEIEDAPNGGSTVPADKLDNMWMHREQTKYWITTRYERTPRPEVWTKETFARYIRTLVCGRLRPHMALAYYGERKGGRLVDTEGARMKLILDAFEDPSARDCITLGTLKMTLAFMSHRAGYRAWADRLVTLAEQWGVPLDTEVFNILLRGYVSNHDVALFFKTLRAMTARFFQPNAHTWLLFLRLVQKDDKRKEIIQVMHTLGFLQDPAARRGVAEVMAQYDAYTAFCADKTLNSFLKNQASRYGEDWLTPGALDGVLQELFRFCKRSHPSLQEFRSSIDEKLPPSMALGINTYNTILEYCAFNSDWKMALWTIGRMRDFDCEPNAYTYQLLLMLSRNSRSPSAFGITLFYGVLARQLRVRARKIVDEVLLGKSHITFWRYVQPRVFSNEMARALEASRLDPLTSPSAGVEWAILRQCDGCTPVQSLCGSLGTAIRTLDGPIHRQVSVEGKHPSEIVHPRDYAVRLFGPNKTRASKIVHLDSRFKPETMVRPRGQAPDQPDGPPEATKHAARVDEPASYEAPYDQSHRLQDEDTVELDTSEGALASQADTDAMVDQMRCDRDQG